MLAEVLDKKRLNSDEKEVAQLFKLSFHLSQGQQRTQEYIFDYLKSRGVLSKLPINNSIPDYILSSFRIPTKHIDVSNDYRVSTIVEVWSQFKRISSNETELMFKDDSHRIEVLIYALAKADGIFQERLRPLVNKKRWLSTKDYDLYSDPHASFLRRYSVLGFTTGNNNLDKMHSDIATRLHSEQDLIWYLEESWHKNHPRSNFYPKEWFFKRSTYPLQPKNRNRDTILHRLISAFSK